MRGSFKLSDPDKITSTLTLTMTLKEWKELRTQLTAAWPAGELSRVIGALVAASEKHFYEDAEYR